MTEFDGFELVRRELIPDPKVCAELYRHRQTGAGVLSLSNDDVNKAFGVVFRTPPGDSTGVAHVLEHMVFRGSRKYPLQDVVAELLKGSLQIFLNAYTYLDSTYFLLASPNGEDYHNLMDVFLDAVLYPRLTSDAFMIEGWRYELDRDDNSLTYNGVVLSEMKGAYSSADTRLADYVRRSLFPDSVYGHSAAGRPAEIPDLSLEILREYHRRYYHPSSALFCLYGDGDTEVSLKLINSHLGKFARLSPEVTIPLQQPFAEPRRFVHAYPAGDGATKAPGHIVTMNWVVGDILDCETVLALIVLSSILLRMPSSPLRQVLLGSRLGESMAGEDLCADIRQPYLSIGLKGVADDNVDKVEALILNSLEKLVHEGIDRDTVAAALNNVEFRLREGKAGRMPRGIQSMLWVMPAWLHNCDPFAKLAFGSCLKSIRGKLAENRRFFEELIGRYLLNNVHRTTVVLRPDPDLTKEEERVESERLASVRAGMDKGQLEAVALHGSRLERTHKEADSHVPWRLFRG